MKVHGVMEYNLVTGSKIPTTKTWRKVPKHFVENPTTIDNAVVDLASCGQTITTCRSCEGLYALTSRFGDDTMINRFMMAGPSTNRWPASAIPQVVPKNEGHAVHILARGSAPSCPCMHRLP